MPPSNDDYTENRPQARPRRPRADDRSAPPPPPRSGGGTKTVLLVLGIVAVVVLVPCCGIVGVVGYFAYDQYGTARERVTNSNNLKEIGLAMHAYHDRNNVFPPPARMTRGGQPGLSWRVAILPYIGHNSLYQQFKQDEPWDSPNNRPLLSQMPRAYAAPGVADPTTTPYRVFVGPNTVFDPARKQTRFTDITDGSSNTLMVVEAATAVPWTKPDELPFTPTTTVAPLLKWRNGKAMVVMCDGSWRVLTPAVNEFTLRNLITINDGNVIDVP